MSEYSDAVASVKECRNSAVRGLFEVGGGTSMFVAMVVLPNPSGAWPAAHALSAKDGPVHPLGHAFEEYNHFQLDPEGITVTGLVVPAGGGRATDAVPAGEVRPVGPTATTV